MTSTRPYLIRAFYDWIVDNNCTPHLVVNAAVDHVQVPREYVDNGQIVLNVSISAVQGLILGDQAIEFQARFGGKIFKVYAPITSILAIYAKENGRGMVFAEEPIETDDEEKSAPPPLRAATGTTRTGTSASRTATGTTKAVGPVPVPAVPHNKPRSLPREKTQSKKVKDQKEEGDDGDDGSGKGGKGKGRGRGHLTLVK